MGQKFTIHRKRRFFWEGFFELPNLERAPLPDQRLPFSGHRVATGDLGKLDILVKNNENPYWAVEDIVRYPTAPPIVSCEDYQHHDWLAAFRRTEEETRSEAKRQLETLEGFKSVSKEELAICCGSFTFLPDYWVFWAIQSNLSKRGDFYR